MKDGFIEPTGGGLYWGVAIVLFFIAMLWTPMWIDWKIHRLCGEKKTWHEWTWG